MDFLQRKHLKLVQLKKKDVDNKNMMEKQF